MGIVNSFIRREITGSSAPLIAGACGYPKEQALHIDIEGICMYSRNEVMNMSYNRQNQIDANAKCSCRGYNLDKLIQPNILIILAKQSMHGYSIIQELENKNLFIDEKVDNTGVYRALKTLEDREMIRFEWVMDTSGPAKKNYMITEKGLECLKNWIRTLEDYKKTIETIIEDGRKILKLE